MQSVNNSSTNGTINDLLRLFEVAPVNCTVLESALALGFGDFEDAVLHEAGRLAGAEVVVTRDPSGFSSSTIQVYAPDTLVAILKPVE
jgi:hypothetical protein